MIADNCPTFIGCALAGALRQSRTTTCTSIHHDRHSHHFHIPCSFSFSAPSPRITHLQLNDFSFPHSPPNPKGFHHLERGLTPRSSVQAGSKTLSVRRSDDLLVIAHTWRCQTEDTAGFSDFFLLVVSTESTQGPGLHHNTFVCRRQSVVVSASVVYALDCDCQRFFFKGLKINDHGLDFLFDRFSVLGSDIYHLYSHQVFFPLYLLL